jgi:methionine synthase II (cobalamin-independent)
MIKDGIWIDPDRGLKTRTIDEAIAKLTNMVKAVLRIRETKAVNQ